MENPSGIPARQLEEGDQSPLRPAFTLIEVLLAILLTGLILVAMSMAIDFHLRVLGSGRDDVEEAQLARALLQRIAADLRSAVSYNPDETQQLLATVPVTPMSTPGGAAGAAGGAGGAGGASGGGAGGAGGASGGSTSEGDSSSIAQRDSEDTSLVTETTPGLYGTLGWLQVDVSRLPRLDQLRRQVAQVGETTLTDRTSDVKSVAYFVAEDLADGTPGGLVCRELDRAVTSWATDLGLMQDMETDLKPIAPEVAAIEFHYYDGNEICDYWDMEERHVLPLAVEIAIQLKPKSEKSEGDAPITYRLLVHLPTGEMSSLDTAASESETESETGSTEKETTK
ncbi:MAG: hypothetical protein NTW96_22050 [Planctomycetia bacterium]|nr:hypothetical protein [Planctomycetia bacterium]